MASTYYWVHLSTFFLSLISNMLRLHPVVNLPLQPSTDLCTVHTIHLTAFNIEGVDTLSYILFIQTMKNTMAESLVRTVKKTMVLTFKQLFRI